MQTLKASVDGLKRIRHAREVLTAKNGWAVDNEQWLEEASVFLPSVRSGRNTSPGSVSIGTWKRFLSGKIAIKAHYFIAFCMVLGLDWREVVENDGVLPRESLNFSTHTEVQGEELINSHQDWGEAPEVLSFFGRDHDLNTLEQWIVIDNCRLVAIVGIAGIGKSTLSVQLLKRIKDSFDFVIWRSLLNSPSAELVVTDIVSFICNQEKIDLSANLSSKVLKLIYHLRRSRCLIVLDNAETILKGSSQVDQYQGVYDAYRNLFKQIGEASHQSCVLLTSREKADVVALLEGEKKPVRSLYLRGLSDSEGKEIVEEHGSFFGSCHDWQDLVRFYKGNPLALNIVAKHIKLAFDSNVSEFLREGKQIFGDLQVLLDWHFYRLSDLEKELVYWLAISREPVSILELKDDILLDDNKQKIHETLELLERRLPIERGKTGITLQPVLIEYITERLVSQICHEFKENDFNIFGSHTLVKGTAKNYIRLTQTRLILNLISRHLTNSTQQIEIALQILRENPELSSSYAPGNLLNLICHLNKNICSYDFSRLTIRQAYLKGVRLHGFDFTNSHFINPVFNQAFGAVFSLSFSPNGEVLAIGDGNGLVHLCKLKNEEIIAVCEGHESWIRSVTFSPDGRKLATCSEDQTVRLWNLATLQCENIYRGHINRVRSVACSPDGKFVASGSDDKTIRLWNVESAQCEHVFEGYIDKIWSVVFSPDGRYIASGSEDRIVRVWNLKTFECEHIFHGHEDWVETVAISPDSRYIVSGSHDQTIRLWNIETSQCEHVLQGHTGQVRSVAISPDGKFIVSGSDDQTIRLWNIETSRCEYVLQGHTGQVRSVAISPDGKFVASASHDQTTRIWSVDNRQCICLLQGYINPIQTVAISPNETFIVSGSDDQTIRLWNIETSQCEHVLQGHTGQVRSVAISPNSRYIVSGSHDQTIRLWNIETSQCEHVLQGHTGQVRSVAFSPDGKFIASGSDDKTIRLWNLETFRCEHVFEAHIDWVWSVAFSSDGQYLVSASDDLTLRLWRLKSLQCDYVFLGHTNQVRSVAFCPNSKYIASGSDDLTVRLWNVKTFQCEHVFEGHTNKISSVTFSLDGQYLVSGGDDQTIRFWNLNDFQISRTIFLNESYPRSIITYQDGKMIGYGDVDGTVKLIHGDNMRTRILRVPRPYEGSIIYNATGLTEVQKKILMSFGALDSL